MKEKNIRIMFFTTIIIILGFSIYYIIKNQDILTSDIKTKKLEEKVSNNIIIGVAGLDTINPITSTSQDVQYISKLIYKSLVSITNDFKVEPELAQEWGVLDSKTYLIRLDENKFWQDGTKFTAKDVEYTVDYIKNNNSIYENNVKNIESVEALNEYTIKIHLKEPEKNFEYMLCFPIVCERENIGTGNFKVESINKNEVILENQEEDKQIIIKNYDTTINLYNAFEREEVDVITTNNINYEEYIGKIGHNKTKILGRNFDYLKFNLKNKVLNHKEVVQAIMCAVNKKEIIYKAYNNMYLQAEFPLQYGSYLYSNDIEYEYNINKAQNILEEAGWKYTRKVLEEKWGSLEFKPNNKCFEERSSKYYKRKLRDNRI